MCCRCYVKQSEFALPYIERAENSALAARLREALGARFISEGEARPTDLLAVIAPDKRGDPAAFPMVWGFSRAGSSAPIVNARVETATVRPAFSDSWARRRCVIPASHYFEWAHLTDPATGKKKTGDKYMIRPKDAHETLLAGLYRTETRNGLTVPVFTVLTGEAADGIRFIHDRMPVILPEDAVGAWIAPDGDPARVLARALTEMVFEIVPK